MLRYVVGRAVWAVALVIAVSFVMYVLFFLAPGNGLSLSGSFANEAQIADASSTQGTTEQRPLTEYLQFVGHLVRADLGTSWRSGDDVTWLLGQAIPASGSLLLGGLLLWMVVALVVGVRSAMRPRGVVDRVGNAFVLFGVSAHPLWLGLLLAWLFGYVLGWTPIEGYCDFFRPNAASECGGPVQWAYHLILPWIVFAAAYAALYTRMIRSGVLENLQEDYVRTARAKGVSETALVRRHALRNALLPIATMLTMDLGLALSGTIFVEHVFRVPGLGFLAFNAIPRRDLPVILGVLVFVSLVIVLLSLIVDVLHAVLDPRITSPVAVRTPQAPGR
jgi:peptide/nickel transport system permease protein